MNRPAMGLTGATLLIVMVVASGAIVAAWVGFLVGIATAVARWFL